MKIGLISDAHGNPEGLARCMRLLERKGVDRLYFLGDAVGYFSGWSEVLRLLKEADATCLLGNHDDYMLSTSLPEESTDAYQMLSRYRETIDPYMGWIATWKSSHSINELGRLISLYHGSPGDPLTGYLYPWDDISSLKSAGENVIAMGHTHRPFVRKQIDTVWMNVGSCGLPRDVGGLASCAVVDLETADCTVFRVSFDIHRLLSQVGYVHPDVLACLCRVSINYVGTLVDDFDM